MSTNLEQAYEKFTEEYANKSNTVSWFLAQFKTHLSKNITLEDWNTLQQHLKNVISDGESIKKLLDNIFKYLSEDNTYTDEEINNLLANASVGVTDLGTFDTESTQAENRRKFAQAAYESSGSFSESKGTLYIGQLGDMKIPVFAQCMSGYGNVFIYESAEGAKSYFNKYLYNVTGGKVLLMGDYSSYSKTEVDNKVTRSKLISTIGNATETLAGIMSAEDKKNLNTLLSLLQDDENNITDTIAEVLAIFNQYPEGANLVELLGGKADKKNTYTKEEINALIKETVVNLGRYTNNDFIEGIKHFVQDVEKVHMSRYPHVEGDSSTLHTVCYTAAIKYVTVYTFYSGDQFSFLKIFTNNPAHSEYNVQLQWNDSTNQYDVIVVDATSYSKIEIDNKLGNIDAILDVINGEVI